MDDRASPRRRFPALSPEQATMALRLGAQRDAAIERAGEADDRRKEMAGRWPPRRGQAGAADRNAKPRTLNPSSPKRPRRRLVLGDQRLEVDVLRRAVDHPPAAGDHHPVGAMRAAERERGDRILRAGKARLVQFVKREVGLEARGRCGRRRPGRGSAPSLPSPSAAHRAGRRRPARSAGAPTSTSGGPPPSCWTNRSRPSRRRRGRPPRPPPRDPRSGRSPWRTPCPRRRSGHPDAGSGEPADLVGVEMDAVRDPGSGAQPAGVVEEIDRALAERLHGVDILVGRLAEVAVQPGVVAFGQSFADSLITRCGTASGEQGASATCIIAPGFGSWKSFRTRSLSARMVSESCTIEFGLQPAVFLGDAHRSARDRHAQAELPRFVDLDVDRALEPGREQVVMIRRRGAARQEELDERHSDGNAERLRRQAVPDALHRDEPGDELEADVRPDGLASASGRNDGGR